MEDETGGLGTPLRPGQREHLERCPPEVRPALRTLYHYVHLSHQARQDRNRLRNEEPPNEEGLIRAKARCEAIDEQVSKASDEYMRQLREWRLRGVSNQHREEAIAILQEEAAVLRDARVAHQKETRELLAELRGEVDGKRSPILYNATKRAVPSYETAEVALHGIARLDELLVRYTELCDAIREEHDRRIRLLTADEHPSAEPRAS